MNRSLSFLFVVLLISTSVLTSSERQNDYWQQHVAYEIDVTLDDSSHTLSAHETVVYTNNSPDTLEYIWFHLWPNAYKNNETAFAQQKLKHFSTRFYYSDEDERGFIDSLDFTADGQSLRWEYHKEWIDVAKVFLNQPLPPGSSVTVQTPFFVKLPNVFSRLGHSGKHYEITQWYPKPAVYDGEGWHPMPYLDQGEFYSEFGSFDVHITLPKDYRIMATGSLVNGEEEYKWLDSLAVEGDALHTLGKKEFKKRIKQLKKRWKKTKKGKNSPVENRPLKTVHFHQDNVHDFAWFADPHWIVRKGELWVADSTRKITLWSMYLAKNAKLWEKSIEYIHDAGYWYSRFYGDYPYEHITAVDGDLSAGGGMEYPNITVISSGGSKDLLEFVIMHEVGHNWFYGILGSNERDHAWMDEGVNEHANIRYWEKKYPQRDGAVIVVDFVQNKLGIARHLDFRWIMGYFQYQLRAVSGDDQPIELTSDEFHRGNYGSIVYAKTAVFMRFLQHYLGEEKTDEVMQEFYETWKFKHPSPDDFRSSFEKHVNEDLSWFFQDVINDTKVIDYGVHSLKGTQATLENLGTMSGPVEVAFFNKRGDELERRWVKGFDGSQAISAPVGTEKVTIDPDNYMPDVNRENNATSKPVRFNFVFDQPTFHHTEVNLLPWFGWNAYNSTTPGVLAYSGFIPGFRYGISVSPQWDFRHSKPVGSVTVQKMFYKTLWFRTLTVHGRASDYSGRQGGKIGLTGVIRRPIESTPSISLNAALYYHHIQSEAVDSTYYSPGSYSVGRTDVVYSHRRSPFTRYEAGGGILLGGGSDTFARIHVTGLFRWQYSEKAVFKTRFWVGGFVGGDDVPVHYRTWMSGGVDPDFQKELILNRTPSEPIRGIKIYEDQFILDGPGLRGLRAKASSATAWGVNFDNSFPYVPVALFADVAGATDFENTFVDVGLNMPLGFITVFVPLYQSWEDKEKTVTSLEWLRTRMRFEIAMPVNIQVGP